MGLRSPDSLGAGQGPCHTREVGRGSQRALPPPLFCPHRTLCHHMFQAPPSRPRMTQGRKRPLPPSSLSSGRTWHVSGTGKSNWQATTVLCHWNAVQEGA